MSLYEERTSRVNGLSFSGLLKMLKNAIKNFPDSRVGSNRMYTMEDIALSAFSVFFTQSPSFLAHQNIMQHSQVNRTPLVVGKHENLKGHYSPEVFPGSSRIFVVSSSLPTIPLIEPNKFEILSCTTHICFSLSDQIFCIAFFSEFSCWFIES